MVATTVAFAQKTKITKGDFKELKGQKEVNVAWDYADAQARGGGPFAKWKAQPEQDWLQAIVDKKNEKEAGRGDDWEKSWKADRENRFHGKFELLFNKGMKKEGIEISRSHNDAKYTLVVHTTMTEPGFSVPMVMTVPASINLTLQLVETGSDKVLGEATAIGAPGNAFAGAAWDTGNRIQESYAKAGKTFAKWLPKKGMK